MHKYLFLLIIALLSINYMAIAIDYSTLYYRTPNNTIERYGYKNPLYLNINSDFNINNQKYPNQNNSLRKRQTKIEKRQRYIREAMPYKYYWF